MPKIAKALPYDEYVIDGLRTKQASELTRAAEFLGSYMAITLGIWSSPIRATGSNADISKSERRRHWAERRVHGVGPETPSSGKFVRCPLPE